MAEKLQDLRNETLDEWEKSLLEGNTENLARFAVLIDQPLHTSSREKDSSVSEKKYSHPNYALNLINPGQPQYQELLGQIYESEHPEQPPAQKAIHLAFDVDAMDRLRFAANKLFQVSPRNQYGYYTEFDARFTDFRINGDNAAHITKKVDTPDQRQKHEMSHPMRLVSAAIVPMKVEPELLRHQESRGDLYSGIQGMLRLTHEDMQFADTIREEMRADHAWSRLDSE